MSTPDPKPPPSSLPVELIYGRPSTTVIIPVEQVLKDVDAKRGER